MDRDAWANARAALLAASPTNAASLAAIETSLLCICLDDVDSADDTACSRAVLLGREGQLCNRWFDKLNVVVEPRRAVGANFEHSALDGHAFRRIVDDLFVMPGSPLRVLAEPRCQTVTVVSLYCWCSVVDCVPY
jgi:carnitine O-acetyltransferase